MYLLIFAALWVLHAILIMKFVKGKIHRASNENNGIYIWLGWIAIFIPIFGDLFSLGFLALSPSGRRSGENLSEEWEETPPFIGHAFSHSGHAVSIEPLSLLLEKDDPRIKQKIMMTLLNEDIPDVNRYLDKLLQEEDAEIVHYAATTINTLHQRFRDSIDSLRKHKDADYIEITAAYDKYLESGLLKNTLKARVLEEYATYLYEELQTQQNAFLLSKYGSALENLGYQEEAINTFLRIIRNYPDHYSGYCGLVSLHLRSGDWSSLKKLLPEMRQRVNQDDIPDYYRQILVKIGGLS